MEVEHESREFHQFFFSTNLQKLILILGTWGSSYFQGCIKPTDCHNANTQEVQLSLHPADLLPLGWSSHCLEADPKAEEGQQLWDVTSDWG